METLQPIEETGQEFCSNRFLYKLVPSRKPCPRFDPPVKGGLGFEIYPIPNAVRVCYNTCDLLDLFFQNELHIRIFT